MSNAPILVQAISPQVVTEGAPWGPLNLHDHIQAGSSLRFLAELTDGHPLPKGLICTQNGTLSGIPANATAGQYDIQVIAENLEGEALTVSFSLTIKARMVIETPNYFNELKSRIWEALGKDLPMPEIEDFLNRPISAAEIYYLLERFATLTIWDVYNLEVPSEKQLLELPDSSPHYYIYDRGCCLVGAPKDLFSHARTLEDALQTAKVMAREVYERGWVIEFAGFNKMVRGAWVELQHLIDKHGREIEILHYTPSEADFKAYGAEVRNTRRMGNI